MMEAIDPNIFGADQQCFGCGPTNPIGLKLKFFKDGDTVVTRFTPGLGQEGPPGIFHGGLQATVVDDLAAWTMVGLKGHMGFTVSMQIRYLRPLRLHQEVVGTGTILKDGDSSILMDTVLKQNGKTGCMAKVVYALLTRERAKEVLGGEMPKEWERFCV